MSYMFFRFHNIFQAFNILLFSFSFCFAHISASTLNDDGLIKKSLKYSKNCTEFCENIICQTIKGCSDGVILKNESYCKCCEACVKFLDNGENCTDFITGSLSLTFGSQSRCKYGSTCQNGKCRLNVNKKSCLQDRDIKKEHIKTGKYANEIWIPQCDEEGYYAAKQKKITKSICVNKSGVKIFGSADDLLENTCVCSRLMQEKFEKDSILFNVNPQEHCSSSGSFDALQCINNLCYCADKNTGDVKSELVRIDYLHNLDCFDIKIHSKKYVRDCETELQRTRKLTYEFWKKGVKIYGIDKVKCDPDGTFKPTQCLPDRCVCTDKKGIGIRQYYAELSSALNTSMTCTCARDENAAAFMSFSCKTDGSYKSFTCFNSECVCVDEDGESISKDLRSIASVDTENNYCDELIKNLSKYAKVDEISSSTVSDDEYDPDDDYDPNSDE